MPTFAGKFTKKMRVLGIWHDATPYQKLLILVMLLFLCGFVFTAAAAVVISQVYGINLLTDLAAVSDMSDPVVLSAMKLMQAFTAVGTFIIPPVIAAFTFSMRPLAFLSLDKRPSWPVFLAVATIVAVSIPLINWMMVWNQHMSLPEFMQPIENWMKASEEKAAQLTEAFLFMPRPSDLVINLFIIALIPAIGEELLFRGVIQPLFKQLIRNTFWAILCTSILFSAMHLQFYGFLPRMVLAMVLGYLLEWSGSLWLPMLLHFLNNSVAVLMVYFYPDINMDEIGTTGGNVWGLVISVLLTAGLLFFIYTQGRKEQVEKMSSV